MTDNAWKKFKNFWKKFWYLIWKDDSIKGWIISIIIMFVFIKFIFFPVLGLITGTSLPLAIVESCSMYHQGNLFSDFDGWWLKHKEKYTELNMNKEQFKEFIFKNGFNKGDILFIIGENPADIEVGDVIIFNAGTNHPIIHRVIEIKQENQEFIFSTIGDNNKEQLPGIEKRIHENQLVGKAVFKLAPYMGWGKLVWVEIAKEFDKSSITKYEGGCEEN